MATLKVEIEVSKELHELGQGLAQFVGAVQVALADGFQAGQDLPAFVTAAIVDLIPAVDGVTKIGDEWAENNQASINAAIQMAGAILAQFVKKKMDA